MTIPCETTIAPGRILGQEQDGIRCWRGIPYAAPPVGDLRFAAPAPVVPWQGVRDATDPGPTAPHHEGRIPGLDLTPIIGNGWVRGDDYLSLNVWTPADDTQNRPVFVFIHGGGLMLGDKDASVNDGTGFARSGAVAVSIAYRLGIEGFLPIPGAPTNIGLRDVLAALQWVRDNIGRFGGDPDNVTICGESAGGAIVSILVASPLSKGLFRRGIAMSGNGSMVMSPFAADKLLAKAAETLKISPDLNGFRSRSPAQCVAAVKKLINPGAIDMRDEQGFDPGFGQMRFQPVVGDDVIPAHPLELLKAGAGADVDVLIGTNRDEANVFFVPLWLDRLLPAFAARWMLGKLLGNASDVLAAYGLGQKGTRAGQVFAKVFTDIAFKLPARRFARAHGGRTHVYEFDWESDACRGRLGAAHAVELGFVFDTLPVVTGRKGMAGSHPPQELAARLHGLWAGFVRDGTLPWAEYTVARPLFHKLGSDRTAEEETIPAEAVLRG